MAGRGVFPSGLPWDFSHVPLGEPLDPGELPQGINGRNPAGYIGGGPIVTTEGGQRDCYGRMTGGTTTARYNPGLEWILVEIPDGRFMFVRRSPGKNFRHGPYRRRNWWR